MDLVVVIYLPFEVRWYFMETPLTDDQINFTQGLDA